MAHNNLAETLNRVQEALTEFFSSGTSNERKREIGFQLDSFQKDPGSAIFALEIIGQTRDHNLLMFLLHCLENFVTKRWPVAQTEIKSKLGVILLDLVPAWNHQFPPYLTSKLLKLIAEIAQFDWPEAYTDFSLRMSQWLMEGKNQLKTNPRQENLALLTGLRLIRTVTEEFTAGNNVYLTEEKKRKNCEQLKNLLVPGILDLIQEILTLIVSYLVVLSPEDASHLNGDPVERFTIFSEIALRSTIRPANFCLDQVIPRQDCCL